MDWIGLDWIGSDDCYLPNFDGLCFSAKQTKNQPWKMLLIILLLFFNFHSWLILIMNNRLQCHGLMAWFSYQHAALTANMNQIPKHIWWCFRRQNEQCGLDWMWVERLTVMVDWIGSVIWWIGLDWILKNGPTDISGLLAELCEIVFIENREKRISVRTCLLMIIHWLLQAVLERQ